MARGGAMRILALTTLGWIMAAQFADEPGLIGVHSIWFPLGIGVSRVQFEKGKEGVENV